MRFMIVPDVVPLAMATTETRFVLFACDLFVLAVVSDPIPSTG
jgi:hypothetical protein